MEAQPVQNSRKLNNKCKEVIVLNTNGDIIETYPSVKETSRQYGCSHTTMLYRIHTGNIVDGLTFKFANPDDKPSKVMANYKYYGSKEYTFDDKLNEAKYAIIEYKTANGVCITPCPFKEYPKPMVASGKCVKCGSFKGKNKTEHKVACSFRQFKS